jgi:hypothetical protein
VSGCWLCHPSNGAPVVDSGPRELERYLNDPSLSPDRGAAVRRRRAGRAATATSTPSAYSNSCFGSLGVVEPHRIRRSQLRRQAQALKSTPRVRLR